MRHRVSVCRATSAYRQRRADRPSRAHERDRTVDIHEAIRSVGRQPVEVHVFLVDDAVPREQVGTSLAVRRTTASGDVPVSDTIAGRVIV